MKIILLLFLFKIGKLKYEKIDLNIEKALYYIPIKISEIIKESYFLFSNNAPLSFYPTTNCKICTKLKLNETKLNLISIKENINIPYYHNNFTGNTYNHNLSIKNLPSIISESEFIGFNKVTYKSSFSYNGIFSLSFLNYNFNTSKKIFALQFIKDNCQVHLGGYNDNLIKQNNNLKKFFVNKDNNNSNDIIYNPIWYIKFNNITINNSPYKFKNNTGIKLTFDIGSDKLHLPKKFFFDNMNKLFPEKSHCQIHPDGYFLCDCGDNYRSAFGNISFYDQNGEIFTIYPVYYIVYETGLTGSTCTAEIKINYENDLFIAGNVVLKNYYSIFNIDDDTFLMYRNEEKDDNILNFILALIIIGFLAILIFGIYFCIKKWRIRNSENEVNQENEQEEENDGEILDDDNIDNIQEPINPGQGESSEETE
jgi:hypothetical protein